MTHGDKDKAKKPASKASGRRSSKAVDEGKGVKAGAKGGGETGAAGKKGPPAKAAAGEKGSPGQGAKGAGKGGNGGSEAKAAAGKGDPGGKGVKARGAADAAPGFNNPAVANAFKLAVKKYPNALRRLTD